MATSCLYGFRKNGQLKLAFNHCDSYPTGFGESVVLFIRENTIKELNEICDKIKLVNLKDIPNNDEILEIIKRGMYYKENNEILNWDNIFWANHTFLSYYKKGFFILPDYSSSLKWGPDYLYIIDLDINKFEVYERFFSNEKDINSKIDKYKLLKSFNLENIPKTWDIECE